LITVREFFELHSLLISAVESELGAAPPVPDAIKEMIAQGSSGRSISDGALVWLGLLDLAVNPHLLRRYVKQNGADEPTLRAYLRFLVGRQKHSETDRDKVDWLATHFFQAREERTKVPTGWPKNEIQSILDGLPAHTQSGDAEILLNEVSSLLEEVKYFEKFSEVTDSRIIQRGRDLKSRFGEDFYDADVLAALINYNLVFGKKFHVLLRYTMDQARNIAGQGSETGAAGNPELMHTDYRSTSDAFRDLGEIGRKGDAQTARAASQSRVTAPAQSPAAQPSSPPPAAAEPPPSRSTADSKLKLRELGIDVEMEALNVRRRTEEIGVRMKVNQTMNSLRTASVVVPLADWECTAFRTTYPESEQSFRAEFARGISHAIAVLSLINDELAAYQDKKNTEYLWKKHYDTLLYLLQEAREHKERLKRLAAATQQKGLIDKSRQLSQTADKLEAGIARVAEIF
jgi:hypothetical protein